jgi:hypothetical protein
MKLTKKRMHRLIRQASLLVFGIALMGLCITVIFLFSLSHFSFVAMRIFGGLSLVLLILYIFYGLLLGYDGLKYKKAPIYLLLPCLVLCISLLYGWSIHMWLRAFAWYAYSAKASYGYAFFSILAHLLCMAQSLLSFVLYQPRKKSVSLKKAAA